MNDREQAFWERAYLATLAGAAAHDAGVADLDRWATNLADRAVATWRERCPDLAADPSPAKTTARVEALERVAVVAREAVERSESEDVDSDDLLSGYEKLAKALNELELA